MVVLLHGAVGGWDEVAVAVAAFVVLWVAIKLAGRKAADDDEKDPEDVTSDSPTVDHEHKEPASAAESAEHQRNDAAHVAPPRS